MRSEAMLVRWELSHDTQERETGAVNNHGQRLVWQHTCETYLETGWFGAC